MTYRFSEEKKGRVLELREQVVEDCEECGGEGYIPVEGVPSLLFAHPKSQEVWAVAGQQLWRWSEAAEGKGIWRQEALPILDSHEAIGGVAVDGTGQVWIRTTDRLLRRPEAGTWQISRRGVEGGFNVHDRLELDTSGWVWFHDRSGLWRAKGNSEENLVPSGVECRGALVDRDGDFWFRTRKGVARLLGRMAWRFHGLSEGLPTSSVWQPVRDGRGRLWAGNEQGLCVYEQGRWKRVLSNRILSLALGKNDDLWAVGSPGGMAFRVDLRNLAVQSLRIDPLPLARIASGLAVTEDGTPWISDAQSGLVQGRSTPKGWVWSRVQILGEDPRQINQLVVGPDGTLAVPYEKGVAVLRGEKWSLVPGVANLGAGYVAFSKEGLLAVGYTHQPRLTFHKPEEDGYRPAGESNLHPLRPQIILLSMAFGEDGILWLGSSGGLIRLRPLSPDRPRCFTPSDGLVSTDCSEGAILVENDRVWIGTSQGLSVFTPGIEEAMPPLRAPLLLSARAGALQLSTGPSVVALPKGLREVNLHFLVPTYRYPGTLRFQYREAGPREDWVDLEQSKLHYPGLSSGIHTWLLRGILEDGQVSPATSFRFEVPPRWWESWEARGAFICLVGLVVYGLIRLRQAQLLARNLELQNEVARQTQALQVASNAKSAFLANMSHELRTPLNAILLYAELLQQSAEEEGMTRMLRDADKIQGAGRHLLALINDILDVSKIEAGQMDLHLEDVDLRRLLDELVATLQPVVEKNGNRFLVDADRAPVRIRTDPTRLRQILSNLLANSAKFTKDGLVSLQIEVGRGDTVEFLVSDSGIGMDPGQMDRVFLEFVQAEAGTSRRYGGSGLGLTLVRRFTELLGGTVVAESAPDMGSVFRVTLPRSGPPA